jgi:hypothetical protein
MEINLFKRTLEDSRIGDVPGWSYASERSSGVFYLISRK